MPTLEEVVKAVAELNPDPAEFATALQGAYQPGYQAVFDRGHKTANTEGKKKLSEMKAELDRMTATMAEKDQAIADASKGNQDVEKVRAAFQKELADLKAKHSVELSQRDQTLEGERAARVLRDLGGILADEKSGFGMFDIHASALAAQFRDRIRFKPDGSYEVLKEAGSEVALQPQDGKPESALRLLAQDIAKSADKAMFRSGAGRGAGSKTDGGAGGGGNKFDRIRDNAKERKAAAGNPARSGNALFERGGLVSEGPSKPA